MLPQHNLGLPNNVDDLLDIRGAEYNPDIIGLGMTPLISRNRPLFSSLYIEEMLADPRLCYALWLLKGPILSNATFEIRTPYPDVQKFVQSIMDRFMRNDATKALKAIECGYQGCEIVRTVRDGKITYDSLIDFYFRDVRVVTNYGQFCGITVNNVPFLNMEKRKKIFLGGAKAFHHVHWREKNRWYGQSRFFGAFIPWWETWTNGGFRDVRRLWFFKNAYEGGTIYHPPGSTRIGNRLIPNKLLADEIMTKKRAGGTLALISTTDAAGAPVWRYEPPTGNPVPAGLLEYGKLLNDEELEGMGIPPEVIESGGDQGFGSATGRQIPQTAFYAVLQELLQALTTDVVRYIVIPDVALNFSEAQAMQVEVIPRPLGNQQNNPQDGGFNGNQFVDDNNQAFGVNRPEGQEPRPDNLDQPVSMSVPTAAAPSGERWITIGGSKSGEEEHKGGFPVKINAQGQIVAGGPAKLKGVHLSKIGEFFDKQREELDKRQADAFDDVSGFFDDIIDKQKPKSAEGAAPGSTRSLKKIIAFQADKWGMDEDTYAQFMDELMGEEVQNIRDRENVKNSLRKMLGKNAASIRKIEEGGGKDKRGGDYSNVKGLDQAAEYLQANYPQFMDSDNAEESVWNLLAEGKQKVPTSTSREFHEKLDEKLRQLMADTGNRFNPYLPTSEPAPQGNDPDNLGW